MATQKVDIKMSGPEHIIYAQEICDVIEESAKARGTGIAKRSTDYVEKKLATQHAIIALEKDTKKFAGFSYIEVWDDGKYVANSGLIVSPDFRQLGLARKIKAKVFELSRKTYPNAKIVGLTTSLAVMKINSELGYIPVTFDELPQEEKFWKGCQSCVNYPILESKSFKNCLCTGMKYDPKAPVKRRWNFAKTRRLLEKWSLYKQRFLELLKIEDKIQA